MNSKRLRKAKQPDSASKTRRRGTDKRAQDSREAKQIAALTFSPEPFDALCKQAVTGSNARMKTIIMAAVTLSKTKGELVALVRDCDGGDLLKPGGTLNSILDDLSGAKDAFQCHAANCDAAIARLLIAAHVVGKQLGA